MQQTDLHFATENIDSYMHDISEYQRITVKEENRLSDIIRNGTPAERQAARDQLICANLKLVVKIAHDFKRCGLGFADLISEGNIGLMTAADKFDPSKGAKFSCYAAWWIKQAMRRAISWQAKVIRIPAGSAQRIMNMDKAASSFIAENGRTPTNDELSELTGYSTEQIATLQSVAVDTYSMYDKVNDESSTTFDQMLSETREDESTIPKEQKDALENALDGLNTLDQRIIYGTYGFGCPCYDERVIAQELGMSVNAVRERLNSILDMFRGNLGLA